MCDKYDANMYYENNKLLCMPFLYALNNLHPIKKTISIYLYHQLICLNLLNVVFLFRSRL